MTQDLDALPLPVPTHFRNGVLYAFSADQIRAARREGYELAMRKAQEGRGPVVLPDGFFDALSDLLGDSNMAERVHRLITSWCDTSPPPKSDEPIPVTDDASAVAYLEWALWKFIDMAGATCSSANVDPRTWAHVMVYAPKSDEAMDALLAARDYVQQALNEHDRMYCRHPATESDRKLIVDDLARVDAALAAQQKGGEA